jgi:hypothetical protein
VVIDYDHIDPAALELCDFSGRRRSAVHRDEQLGLKFLRAARDAITTQAVAFIHSMRQESRRLTTKGAQLLA